MPSRPSLARTLRKEAGTETRPLVSILLVNAETNWSISPSWAPGPTRDTLGCETPRPENWVGEAARFPPWPRKERCRASPTRHRTGKYGIAWDVMGGQGISWEKA